MDIFLFLYNDFIHKIKHFLLLLFKSLNEKYHFFNIIIPSVFFLSFQNYLKYVFFFNINASVPREDLLEKKFIKLLNCMFKPTFPCIFEKHKI